MILKLDEVLAELGIEDSRESLAPHWDESEASLPDTTPHFLEAAQIAEVRPYTRLPAEVEPLLLEAARHTRETPALLHLAWHCYRLLFEETDYDRNSIGKWPQLETLGDLSSIFYMVIALAVVPLTRATHERLGVPEAVTRECVSHFNELIWSYRNLHPGEWGLPLRVLYWLRNYTGGILFTLGRMEYMVRPFSGQLQAFRNRETNQVLALAEAGVWFTADGYIDAEAGPDGPPDGWKSRLVVGDETVTGCPISPAGVALRCEVQLPLQIWRRVLAPGDPMLDTHIPAGGGMTLERCEDTMRRALEFFPQYLPDRPFVGFACASWILNPQLAEIYSPTSNMVLWQRELYLLPWSSGGRSGLYFVFGRDDVDPATAPRDTSLRRALLDHLAAGGRLISGGMFFLKEDFEHFGTQHYLSHWPPAVLENAVEI